MGSIGAPELIVLFLVVVVIAVVVIGILRGAKKLASGSSELVPCRACGKKISPRAPTCPQCGEPRQPLHG